MGVGARARYGLRFRRFLYYGLCLPGRAQIQAHRFMATATRVPSLPLMIAGIVLQTVAHLLSPPSLSLEVVACHYSINCHHRFRGVMVQTIRRSGKRETYDRFLYAALGMVSNCRDRQSSYLQIIRAGRLTRATALQSGNIQYSLPRRPVTGVGSGNDPGYFASPVATRIWPARTLETVDVISILGSERINSWWSGVLHRGNDVRQSLAIDVAVARFYRLVSSRDHHAVSISTIRRGCCERE